MHMYVKDVDKEKDTSNNECKRKAGGAIARPTDTEDTRGQKLADS